MLIPSLRQQAAFFAMLFVLLLVLVPRAGHEWDMHLFFTWACYIFDHGLGNAYQAPYNTYNPLYQYLLWAFGKAMGSTAAIDHARHWLKFFPLLFDFAGAFWACSLAKDKSRRFGLCLLLLFNIGYLYNTLIWEQIDTIYTFFAFGAAVLAIQRRTAGSFLLYLLALATKTQAIIFLPPLLLLWLPQWWHAPTQLIKSLLFGSILLGAILLPFTWFSWENYLPHIVDFNLNVTEVFPKVTMGAYNVWHQLLPGSDPNTMSDALSVAGLTYHQWGLVMFCFSSAAALLPLLIGAIRQLLDASKDSALSSADLEQATALPLLSIGLIPLLFFFFNTQMHERYCHAAVLFFAAYGFIRRDYLVFCLISIAYFLNLEGVLKFLKLPDYNVSVFTPAFVSLLFGATIVLAFIKLYRGFMWRASPGSV